MKKILYLHIGMPKTGTSALQRFFKINSNRLKEQGVIYPETGQYDDYSHHDIPFSLAENMYKKPLSKAEKKSFLDRLKEEIQDYPRVLLSSECFPMLGQNYFFFKFASQYDTKIICYLRRQDLFIESHYKQVIADPALPDSYQKIDKHIAQMSSMMTYSPFIANWTRLGSLVIRPYERDSFVDGNIFSDFGDVIDVKIDESFALPAEDINPTNSNGFVEFVRLLKSHKVLDSVLKVVSVDDLRTLVTEAIPNENRSSFLSRQQRIDILDKYNIYNQKIAQLYLDKDKLFSDVNMHDYEELAYDGLSEQELFYLLSKIMDKVTLEESFLGRWKYSDGMTEQNVFDLFSEVMKIDPPNYVSKRNTFSLAKKLLNRFYVSRKN